MNKLYNSIITKFPTLMAKTLTQTITAKVWCERHILRNCTHSNVVCFMVDLKLSGKVFSSVFKYKQKPFWWRGKLSIAYFKVIFHKFAFEFIHSAILNSGIDFIIAVVWLMSHFMLTSIQFANFMLIWCIAIDFMSLRFFFFELVMLSK